jgi:PhnB protein
MAKQKIKTTITPLLYVKNGAAAIEFYKKAFGVIELMRVDGPDGIIVAELSLDGATFFLSDDLQRAETLVRSRSMAPRCGLN